MVTTHKQMAEKKAMKFDVKPDNPARKNMSYAEAVADNQRMKDEKIKIARFAESLRSKDKASVGEVQNENVLSQDDKSVEQLDDKTLKKIVSLEADLSAQRGPGAKERKEKIQAKIDELKGVTV